MPWTKPNYELKEALRGCMRGRIVVSSLRSRRAAELVRNRIILELFSNAPYRSEIEFVKILMEIIPLGRPTTDRHRLMFTRNIRNRRDVWVLGKDFDVSIFSTPCLHAARTCCIERVVPDIGVEVHLVGVTDGVGLKEAPDLRPVIARPVIVEPGIRIVTSRQIRKRGTIPCVGFFCI
jgi:hypothetical protein